MKACVRTIIWRLFLQAVYHVKVRLAVQHVQRHQNVNMLLRNVTIYSESINVLFEGTFFGVTTYKRLLIMVQHYGCIMSQSVVTTFPFFSLVFLHLLFRLKSWWQLHNQHLKYMISIFYQSVFCRLSRAQKARTHMSYLWKNAQTMHSVCLGTSFNANVLRCFHQQRYPDIFRWITFRRVFIWI